METPLRPGARVCVVTCDDASLTAPLAQALGAQAAAVLVRLPGAGGGLPEEWVGRAVFKAVVVDGCEEVLLLTHAGCSLESVQATSLIDALSRRGIPRAAVPWDLREAVGAGRDVRTGVRELAAMLRRAAYLPESVSVHVGHLADGQVQIIERGDVLKVQRSASASATGPLASAPGPVPLESVPPSASGPVPLDRGTTPIQSRPTSPGMRAASAPAKSKSKPPAPPSKPPRPPTLPPDAKTPNAALASSLAGLRVFLMAELTRAQRLSLGEQLRSAAEAGVNSPALVKIVLDPVLQLGEVRYRVIDEMIAVKDALSAAPPKVALEHLGHLLR